MKIDLIVGARPNFVKAAALLHAAKDFPQIEMRLVHTGQHRDIMSDPYFKDLRLHQPTQLNDDLDLGIGFGQMIGRLDYFWYQQDNTTYPDYVMVVGDTDSTLAGAIAAAKSGISVLHVEAGLRCGDMKMQEEINRILVDSIALKHYTTSDYADRNLRSEGKQGIQVGNVMVDTLLRFLPEAREKFSRKGPYAIFTLHRAENIDDAERRYKIIAAVDEISERIPILWPMHTRLQHYAGKLIKTAIIVPPMSYLEFIAALESASFVLTDSGGVQEETTILHVPCLTLRDNTERPETVSCGTNRVIGTNPARIVVEATKLIRSDTRWRSCLELPLWDGHAAKRIMEDICATL